jgi:hypothetical protein
LGGREGKLKGEGTGQSGRLANQLGSFAQGMTLGEERLISISSFFISLSSIDLKTLFTSKEGFKRWVFLGVSGNREENGLLFVGVVLTSS